MSCAIARSLNARCWLFGRITKVVLANTICGQINLRIPECLNVCLNSGSGDEMASGECPIHNIIRNLSWGHQCHLASGPGASENGLGWMSRRP